jgi:hypothetical protein
MDFLPDEIKLVIISYVSKGKILAVNKQWLTLIKVSIHDRILHHLKQINMNSSVYNKHPLKLRKHKKVFKIINNKYGNPTKFIISTKYSNIIVYDAFSNNYHIRPSSCTYTGTDFYIVNNRSIIHPGNKFKDTRVYGTHWIVNDHIFEEISTMLYIYGGDIKSVISLNVGNVWDIQYSNHKYIIFCLYSIKIYDDNFNFVSDEMSFNFVYPHDKILITDSFVLDDTHVLKNYTKKVVVNDYIYLLDKDDKLWYFNINTKQLEFICKNIFYIHEINERYIIISKNHKLYVINV